MKRRMAVVALFAIAAAVLAQAQFAPAQGKNQPQVREMLGQVTNRADTPLANAIVYLKNTKTLAVKTYITAPDGKYRFPGLSQNIDYEVYAEYQGRKSDARTLSSFDSRTQAYINLKVDTAR